jgi:hypothetical protein
MVVLFVYACFAAQPIATLQVFEKQSHHWCNPTKHPRIAASISVRLY